MKALATRRFFMSSAAAIPLLRGVGVWTGPDSFAIFSHGPKPWTIINLRDLSLFPLSAEINAEIGTVLAGRNVADLDPRVDGLELFRIQRAGRVLPIQCRAFFSSS